MAQKLATESWTPSQQAYFAALQRSMSASVPRQQQKADRVVALRALQKRASKTIKSVPFIVSAVALVSAAVYAFNWHWPQVSTQQVQPSPSLSYETETSTGLSLKLSPSLTNPTSTPTSTSDKETP
jgi:hypothetical protein